MQTKRELFIMYLLTKAKIPGIHHGLLILADGAFRILHFFMHVKDMKEYVDKYI